MSTNGPVLVIDDEPTVRAVLIRFLDRLGYTSREASSGHEAIELARRERPILILCDMRIPGCDTAQLLDSLAAQLPEVPVVRMSGEPHESTVAPRGPFLSKPFVVSDLAAALLVALGSSSPARQERL